MTQRNAIVAWLSVFWTLCASANNVDSLYIQSLLNLNFTRAAEWSRAFSEPERSHAVYDLGFMQSFLTGTYVDPKVSGEDFIDRLDRLDHDEAYAIKSEYHLKRAILAYYREETVSVGLAIYYSYKNAKKALAKNPDDPHARAINGLFLYLVGSIPEDYRSWFSMIGVSGDATQGLALMREVAQQNPHTITAVKTRLALAFFEIQAASSNASNFTRDSGSVLPQGSSRGQSLSPGERATTSLPPVKTSLDGLPPSLMRTYLQSRYAYKSANPSTSLLLLKEVVRNEASVHLPYAHLLLAKFALAQGSPRDALLHLDEFERHYSGSDYQKAVALYRGWIGLMRNDLPQYRSFKNRVPHISRKLMAEDIMADSEAKRDHLPELVQARMMMSYSGYEQVRQQLQSLNYNSLATGHQSEWLYLMGRIEQKQGQWAKAQTVYLRLLQLPWSQDHFIPNALLQLASMAMASEDRAAAQDYLDRLQKYTGYPYEASIKWQAKQLRANLK